MQRGRELRRIQYSVVFGLYQRIVSKSAGIVQPPGKRRLSKIMSGSAVAAHFFKYAYNFFIQLHLLHLKQISLSFDSTANTIKR